MRFFKRFNFPAVLLCAASIGSLPVTVHALDLSQAEMQLFERNHDILAARRAMESATAGITIAGQAPNPTLSYSTTDMSPTNGIGSGSLREKRMDQTIAIQQLIERGDRRSLRTASAEALSKAAQAEYADVRRVQRFFLHQAWFDLLAAQERQRLLGETAALYKRALEAADLRVKAGDLARVDASRLRVEALRAENDARTARADTEKAQRMLSLMIGTTDVVVPEVRWPAVTQPGETPVLDNRPVVRAAEARIAAATQNRTLARSLTTRDVTVGASVEKFAPAPGVTYGLSVAVPLFVRYAYEGEQAQAETAYTAALEARERAIQSASAEAVRARADLAAAVDRVERAEKEALPQAREVGAASELAYKKGAIGLTDLLDARRTLRAVELEAVAARADHAKALAAWLAATEWEKSE